MTKQEREDAVNLISQTILYIPECNNIEDATKLYIEAVNNGQFACNLGLITPVAFDIIVYRAQVFLNEKKESLVKKQPH